MKRIQLIPPKQIDVTIQLPSSKSICNRALIINALAHGNTQPENLSDCDDTQVMIRALTNMPPTIDIHAAGTAMRFLTAYLAVTEGTHVITGTERMQQRPIRILVDALRSLGAEIEYTKNEGYPPLKINGRQLTGSEISLPGNVSSQYISALLMIAPTQKKGLQLTLTGDIISRPYIDLTLELMRQFGAKAQWTDNNRLKVDTGGYQPRRFTVESDWSAASYWYEIVSLSEQAAVRLPRLSEHSLQGDSKVADLFGLLGVSTTYLSDEVILRKEGETVSRLEYDFINQPDLAQTFVVTCAMLNVPFRFTGLQSLKIKETDRISALMTEMKKLGYVLTENNGSELSWEGERCEADTNPAIDTYEDHRMAMAFAPAILRLKNLRINHPEVVSKSYPHYWENLSAAGFGIIEE